MQIHQLTYFVAVARTRHFTRAAEITGVSQPTLSKQIRVLENSLGAPLFVRNRGAIELTSAGEALLPHAQRILIDVQSAERTVHEVASLQRGRVRLGATPSLCDGLLPEALTRFHESYPQIDLEVQEAGSRVLTGELAQGRLDIALLIVPLHTSDPDIETTPVLRERLVLASPVDADVPDRMSVGALRDLPLVMFREGYDLRDVTLRACASAGFEPRLAVEGGEMSAVLRFVQAGLGHAVVPSMVLTTRPQLRATELVDPPLERVIALAHRSSEALPLAARAFKADLLEHLTTFATGDLALL
ncbi:LysR substrate-binding domain-containing protein [Aeromicrobium chenweiae]|uniref:LysR family transcriptional regulator n=1 Tax=Aeromicrobium chenweiae TaxID=2079793 RepID=A0A2S0WPM1_9ACTN|nr:LysR substrate-binding domain-containing protein [Aeromicrobium chenweiae]AWB93266.1 LysR family transcriptional regulator [Aeromicrobium chenweiae]TGN34259.1 LysR family transcriptional regulator [Aeromicrobium chenweiae]